MWQSKEPDAYFLGLHATALSRAGDTDAALDVVIDALDAVERSGERFYAAELHRQRGELLLAKGDDRAGATRSLETALHIAREQRARALERRALLRLENVSRVVGRGR